MRHQARALLLVFVSLLTVMALSIASAFVSALAYGATALIVPGTGTPNADVVKDYRENAWSRYIDGVVCTVDCSDPDLVGIPYPASFWPLSFIPGWCVPGRCDKWNVSVGEGTENLLTALSPFLDPASEEDVYIFGYSQGGAVVANALSELGLLDLPDEVKERLKVVTIGGIENPDGGFWQRLAWLQNILGNPIPVLDVSFDPAMPVDTGIGVTSIGFEYDPVVYAPKYWGNAFAILNMIAAFDEVHPYYLAPNQNNENPMPYGYTDATLAPQLNCDLSPANCRTDSFGNSYIMVPATSLPLMNVVRALANSIGIGALAKPFLDLAEPVVREIVDLGFDWGGNPGVSSPLSILPFKIFQNWVKVGIDFAVAAVKGVEAFIKNFIPEQTAASKDADDTVVALAAPDEELPSGAAEDAPVEELADGDADARTDDEVVTAVAVGDEDGTETGVVVDEDQPAVSTDEDAAEADIVTTDEEGAVTETEEAGTDEGDSVAETADEDASERDTDTQNDTPAAA